MRRHIGVVTTGRADFGHVRPIAREIARSSVLELQLIATGTHAEVGEASTADEIRAAGLPIASCVGLRASDDTHEATAEAIGRGVVAFTKLFRNQRPDILLLSGDRFEMFAAAVAGFVSGLVLAHLSGGDVTEGALDEGFRHSMTKLSHIHFPTSETSARRLRRMGEEAWRIHVVGEPSLDLLREFVWPSDEDLAKKLGIEAERWEAPLLVTVHPATIHPEIAAAQADHVIDVLRDFEGLVIITAANRDPGGVAINERLRAFAAEHANVRFHESLGWESYASLMRRARAMIGNSSSGLLEAPAFELPVVNIGDRQQGRMRAANVIDADDTPSSIRAALDRALSDDFRATLRGLVNPYGNGDTGAAIAGVLESIDLSSSIRTKRFAEANS